MRSIALQTVHPTHPRSSPPLSLALGPPPEAARLLAHARTMLGEAARTDTADERFRLAHVAALRMTAALFVQRAQPSGRRRLVSAWVLVRRVAPELGEWADLFAASAPQRAAIEAGALRVVTARQADDQLRAAAQFLTVVEDALGMVAAVAS